MAAAIADKATDYKRLKIKRRRYQRTCARQNSLKEVLTKSDDMSDGPNKYDWSAESISDELRPSELLKVRKSQKP